MPELNQPFANMRFRIAIEGMAGTGALEVVLPEARIVAQPRKARRTQYSALVLRRGVTRSSEWYDWWHAARGASRRAGRAVLIALLDDGGRETIRWAYTAAHPVAYQVSSLHALGNEPLVETLELSVGGFEASFAQTGARGRKRS